MKIPIFSILLFFVAITVTNAQIPTMGAGDLLNQFTKKGLSDEAMTPEFKDVKKDFLKSAKTMTDAADIGMHINKLVGFIKPGMFKNGVDVNQLMEMGSSVASIADAAGLLGKLQDSLIPGAFKSGWGKQQDAFNSALDALK